MELLGISRCLSRAMLTEPRQRATTTAAAVLKTYLLTSNLCTALCRLVIVVVFQIKWTSLLIVGPLC